VSRAWAPSGLYSRQWQVQKLPVTPFSLGGNAIHIHNHLPVVTAIRQLSNLTSGIALQRNQLKVSRGAHIAKLVKLLRYSGELLPFLFFFYSCIVQDKHNVAVWDFGDM